MKEAKPDNYASSIDTTSWITLRSVRGARYHRVHLEQDLWNGWLLTKVQGHRNSPLERRATSLSIEIALLKLAAIAERRRLRGYELTN